MLMTGDLSPEVVTDWEQACLCYFMHKGVDVTDRIKFVSTSFQDHIVQGWYQSNTSSFTALSWCNFIKEFLNHFLDPNWDRSIHSELLSMKIRTSTTFLTCA